MAAEEGSERELEEFLAGTGVFGGERQEAEETGEVVHDEPPGFEPPPDDTAPTPPASAPPAPGADVEEKEVEEDGEQEGEPHLVWARKKYGTDPEAWAKAAFNQEKFITQLNADKRQAEEIAQNAIEYAQQVEASAQSQASSGLPLSASEEAWVEQSAANPTAYAYQAARSGNMQLYQAVIENISIENPMMAGQVAAQVNMALQEEQRQAEAQAAEHRAAAQNGGAPGGDFNGDLQSSFQRLGINVQQYGEAMWTKFDELGEYHPYTLAVLGGDPIQRDLAVSAVYDLVRQGQATTRRVGDETREEQIRREGELRRGAASIVTGSPHVEPQKESPLMEGMMEEWRRRGQWVDEE
jgi:hypothetical protein